jgi:hypothetical protein
MPLTNTLVQWSTLCVLMLLYMCPHTTVYDISIGIARAQGPQERGRIASFNAGKARGLLSAMTS